MILKRCDFTYFDAGADFVYSLGFLCIAAALAGNVHSPDRSDLIEI